jgi:hypothetical protein
MSTAANPCSVSDSERKRRELSYPGETDVKEKGHIWRNRQNLPSWLKSLKADLCISLGGIRGFCLFMS